MKISKETMQDVFKTILSNHGFLKPMRRRAPPSLYKTAWMGCIPME